MMTECSPLGVYLFNTHAVLIYGHKSYFVACLHLLCTNHASKYIWLYMPPVSTQNPKSGHTNTYNNTIKTFTFLLFNSSTKLVLNYNTSVISGIYNITKHYVSTSNTNFCVLLVFMRFDTSCIILAGTKPWGNAALISQHQVELPVCRHQCVRQPSRKLDTAMKGTGAHRILSSHPPLHPQHLSLHFEETFWKRQLWPGKTISMLASVLNVL